MIEEKRQFAQLLVDGMDENKAAFEIFPKDPANRMKASIQWRTDSEVIAFTKEILGIDKKESKLMTKEEHVEMLEEIFKDSELDPKHRLVASEQIAKMQGFISEKKETNTTINNKIMVVTRSNTDQEWEKSVAKQQERLVNDVLVIKQIDSEETDEA